MNRPRKYYGWQDGDKFKVSLWPKSENRAANIYASKDAAIMDAIKRRTDSNGAPSIEWEDNG